MLPCASKTLVWGDEVFVQVGLSRLRLSMACDAEGRLMLPWWVVDFCYSGGRQRPLATGCLGGCGCP